MYEMGVAYEERVYEPNYFVFPSLSFFSVVNYPFFSGVWFLLLFISYYNILLLFINNIGFSFAFFIGLAILAYYYLYSNDREEY